MDVEILLPVIAAVVSMVAGGVTSTPVVQKVLRKIFPTGESAETTYSQRLGSLTESLTKSSQQVDSILGELARVAAERQTAVSSLEENLKNLETREKDLQERIEHLQKVPIPAVEHFAKLMETGEKRSAWRDYILFGAGVVVSTAISIGLKFSGLG